jgi:carboxyl-terminal processing protease
LLLAVVLGFTCLSCMDQARRGSAELDRTSTVSPTTTVREAAVADRAAFLYEVIDVVEANAYYASRVDFPAWRKRIAAVAATGPVTFFDSLQLVGQLLGDLNDRHSHRLGVGELQRLDSDFESDTLIGHPPDGGVHAGSIGYLNVPAVEAAIGSGAYRSYVSAANEVLTEPACGWIVDLRINHGGSVPPMLAAIAPLLGSGVFIGYKGLDGRILAARTSNSAVTIIEDAVMTPASASTAAHDTGLSTKPVAVLIGPGTASAGEGVVIAFTGRRSTRSFGAPTAGIPTGNSEFELSDHSALVLTTTVGVDRYGRTHEGPIQPTVPVTTETSTADGDTVIAAATAWLREQTACQ